MYYETVIFNAENRRKLTYCFKVNMICNELEITYDNFLGGYTTKGIKLNRKQHTQLKQLLKVDDFEKYRDNLNIDKWDWLLDPYSWSLECISNDGKPMLEISDGAGDFIMTPSVVSALVEYVTSIGIEPELLEKMRLF